MKKNRKIINECILDDKYLRWVKPIERQANTTVIRSCEDNISKIKCDMHQ